MNKIKIKTTIKYLWFFLLPIIATFCLYPPKEKIIFNGKNYQQTEFKIENLFQKKPTLKNLIADIFSVPLFLDWYKVTITNNSTQENPSCLIEDPTIIRFTFLKGDPRTYYTNLKEGSITSSFGRMDSQYPDYHLKSGDRAFFVAPSWNEYSINGGLIFGGCQRMLPWTTDGEFESRTNTNKLNFDYDISIKPYWISWVVQLFVISIFWIFLWSSILSVWKWLKT